MTGKTGLLEQNIIQFIKEHNLISDGDKVIVGVSGGADSVCLLDILVKHRVELNITLHAAHLNHMLRDKESEEDEQYVRQLSNRLSIAATIERRSVTSYQKQNKCSLEEAAREVRYRFFAEIARREDTHCIAVGHTRDDDVETVLMHLLRGTGISGLRGLQPLSLMQPGDDTIRIKLIRPLLKTGRNETEEYCKQYRLSIRQDSSNRDTAFLRNRIRLELLPHLRNYNPRIDDALLRMAHSVEENISCIEMLASLKWNELVEQRGSALYLNISKESELHPALQKQLFRMAIERVAGTLKDIESDHIEQMVQFMAKPSGKTLHLPYGLRLATEYGYLVLTTEHSQAALCPFPLLNTTYPLKVPGDTALPGWLVKTIISDAPAEAGENGITAMLDLDRSGTELYVRTRQQGDRFQPLGMEQTKKLQDFMVDAKIPVSWRNRIPLLCTGTQILWLVGWRIDDRFKTTDSTKKVLQITFTRSD